MTGTTIKMLFLRNYQDTLSDVQIELTSMVFKSLGWLYMAGLLSVVAAEMVTAYGAHASWMWPVAGFVLLTAIALISLINAFNWQAAKKLTPGRAYEWQAALGGLTLFFAAGLASLTLGAFMAQDTTGALVSMLAVFACCAGLRRVNGLLPWIARVSSLVMFIVLGFAAAVSIPSYGWGAAALIAYIAFQQWEAEGTKFILQVSKLRSSRRIFAGVDDDHLTGLAPPSQFMTSLELACHRRINVSILLLDIDNFHPLLERFGASMGDRLLQLAAARLQKVCRGSDMIARLDTDEFAILAQEPAGQNAANSLVERIHATLATPICIDDRAFKITVSIGICSPSEGQPEAADSIRAARKALHAARAKGGSCLAFA